MNPFPMLPEAFSVGEIVEDAVPAHAIHMLISAGQDTASRKTYSSFSKMKGGRLEYLPLRFSISSIAAALELKTSAGVRKNLAKTTSPVDESSVMPAKKWSRHSKQLPYCFPHSAIVRCW